MELNEFTLQRIAAMEAAFDRTAAAVQALYNTTQGKEKKMKSLDQNILEM